MRPLGIFPLAACLQAMPPANTLDEVFGLATPRDFLDKARREVERLQFTAIAIQVGVELRLQVADHAINAAVSLWHVRDWLARFDDPRVDALVAHAKKMTGTRKTNRLKILGEFVLRNDDIALCNDVCNGSKHLVFGRPEPVIGGDVSIRVENGIDQPSLVEAVMSAPSSFDHLCIAKIVLDDERRLPALDVYRRALAFWESLLGQHGL